MGVVSRFELMKPAGADPSQGLVLRRGELRDYAALAPFHYRVGQPATVCDVLALVDGEGAAVACLVVSRPTLNAWWRMAAWPGEFDGDKRDVARAVNERLRTIARVIVEPRYRGIGLAMRLVREYVREPLTPRTEAVAAMGRVCPFFERAGMVRHERARSRRDEVLLCAIRKEGERPKSLLEHVPRGLKGPLRTWADASRATRGLEDSELGRAAAAALLFPVIAYTSPPSDEGGSCSSLRPSRTLTGCTSGCGGISI